MKDQYFIKYNVECPFSSTGYHAISLTLTRKRIHVGVGSIITGIYCECPKDLAQGMYLLGHRQNCQTVLNNIMIYLRDKSLKGYNPPIPGIPRGLSNLINLSVQDAGKIRNARNVDVKEQIPALLTLMRKKFCRGLSTSIIGRTISLDSYKDSKTKFVLRNKKGPLAYYTAGKWYCAPDIYTQETVLRNFCAHSKCFVCPNKAKPTYKHWNTAIHRKHVRAKLENAFLRTSIAGWTGKPVYPLSKAICMTEDWASVLE